MIGKECNTATVDDIGKSDGFPDVQHQGPLINTGALQSAIFNSANFSSIATDAKGVIQIFNVGAERMLGYTADEVTNSKRSHPLRFYAGTGIAGSGGSSRPLRAARMTVPR
jgi:PAS domain-containing protein